MEYFLSSKTFCHYAQYANTQECYITERTIQNTFSRWIKWSYASDHQELMVLWRLSVFTRYSITIKNVHSKRN